MIDSGRFDVVQIYYNLLNPTAMAGAGAGWNSTDFDGLLHRCAAKDMGVMDIRIFAAGHLATTERHGREMPITANAESAAEEPRAKAALDLLGSQYGTPAQAALRFGLACPLLSTIVVGIGETWHLDQALAAAEMGPLPASAHSGSGDAAAHPSGVPHLSRARTHRRRSSHACQPARVARGEPTASGPEHAERTVPGVRPGMTTVR